MPFSQNDIVLICGSRSIDDIELDCYINPDEVGTVISGGAKGIDTLAERWAKRHKKEFLAYLPQYKIYGRAAPLVRDREMVEACDRVIAFWDGKSSGTYYTIIYSIDLNKPHTVHVIESRD